MVTVQVRTKPWPLLVPVSSWAPHSLSSTHPPSPGRDHRLARPVLEWHRTHRVLSSRVASEARSSKMQKEEGSLLRAALPGSRVFVVAPTPPWLASRPR